MTVVQRSWFILRLLVVAGIAMALRVGDVYAASVTLNASGGDGRIDLGWTASEPITGVQVYRDTDANPVGRQRIAILPGSARSYSDRAVVNGTRYWYWIKYSDASRAIGNSNAGSATPAASNPSPQPPADGSAMVTLSATGGEGKVDLTWTVDGSIATIQVMRDTDANPSGRQRVATLPGSARGYTDKAVANGIRYWYWIKYADAARNVGNSNAGSATPTAAKTIPVTGVAITPTAANVMVGASVSLGATVQPGNASNRSVSWSSSNRGVATVSAAGVVTGVGAGIATITVTTADGNRTATSMVTVAKQDIPSTGGQCEPYDWPGYTPDLNYNFRQDFANIDPSKFTVYKGCSDSQIAGVKTSGWYAFIWGHNRNPAITDADIDRVLKNLNEDMAFARDKMGWPPDRLPQEGHFSNVYLFGSGLCTDNASNTEKGGWQSGINGYPMVLLSYYPVVTPSERGGITHEAIHAVLATMGNKAAWFNEGGNTWLQMNMEAARTGGYGVGFLDGAPFLAPHMPIENYSGWLQDGSFGGPNAEGVDQYRNGQQISTWREYLGGNQYNSAFAHFLAVHVSAGANAWIWKKGKSNGVLASLAEGLGDEQVRHLIMEYRARQAMVDFGPWSDAFKVPINDNWGRSVGAEPISGGILQDVAPYRLGFYAETTRQGDTLVPKTDTLPGWSGANQIPLQTNGKTVRVDFEPIGQNMRFQLAYRAQDGSVVYGKPVEKGEACLNLDKAPKNGVVVGVVSNTDYQYQGDETRKRKYDYRVRLLEGVSGTASTTGKYFQ